MKEFDAEELLRAPTARSQRYTVNVYDCAGPFSETDCDGFADALQVYRTLRAQHFGKVVRVFNNDRCDYDTDGLTEDEREALDE